MRTTQCNRLLQWFLNSNGAGKKTITPLEAWSELGIYRLGARIWDLKHTPWNCTIETKIIPVKNRWDETFHVAEYTFISQAEPGGIIHGQTNANG